MSRYNRCTALEILACVCVGGISSKTESDSKNRIVREFSLSLLSPSSFYKAINLSSSPPPPCVHSALLSSLPSVCSETSLSSIQATIAAAASDNRDGDGGRVHRSLRFTHKTSAGARRITNHRVAAMEESLLSPFSMRSD